MVLEKGSLVECGTHDELMAQNGLYAHLYTIQYRSKETHWGEKRLIHVYIV